MWNYRVIRYRDGSFGIHEVYYNDNKEPVACAVSAVIVMDGETYKEAKKSFTDIIEMMDMAFCKDILNYEDF